MTPFPHDRLFSGSNSGSRPYFEGPKSAAWLATSVKRDQRKRQEWVARPAVASSIEPNSITLVQIVIWRLLKRSASQPPGMLKIRNGTEKRNVTTETNVSRSALRQAHPDDHREQQVAQNVVAEGALELRGDKRPEAAMAARRCR